MNLTKHALTQRTAFVVALAVGAVSLSGCSKADENVAAAPPATAAAPTTAAPAAGPVGVPITAPEKAPTAPPPPPTAEASAWTPAALDELLAPIALYPEPVLAQVLAASTNSQEVLDAGNWLIDNETLKGDALTKAASEKGFSPAVQALVQFPTVVDMMCRELDWTKQLGDAFSADQSAVLASVQRLRAQAAAAGNLKSSPQMTVDTTEQQGKTVIEVKPADPQVIYVPQYNPETVYTAAPAATTTTTTTSSDSGITTNEAVMGGLLAFGAGILVANVFDDDDDHYGYGYPNYGYGGVYYGGRPFYPGNTFVYAPRYNGYRPANGYRPPGGYGNNYRNTNVNVNQNNNYYNRFDKNQNRASTYQAKSPVAGDRAGSGNGYKGADRARNTGATAGTRDRATQGSPSGAYKGGAGNGSGYKGATQNRQASSGARREAQASQRPTAGADRGYPQVSGGRSDAGATSNRGGSFNGAGANQGGMDRAASQRGRDSMQSAPRPSSQQRAASSGGGRSGSGGGSRSGGGGGGGRGGGGGGGGGGRGGRG
jgi:hypothetical protein